MNNGQIDRIDENPTQYILMTDTSTTRYWYARTKYDFFLTPELLVISSAKSTVLNYLKLTYTTCILNPSNINEVNIETHPILSSVLQSHHTLGQNIC